MSSGSTLGRTAGGLLAAILIGGLSVGCGMAPEAQVPRLRIVNAGAMPAARLTVLFPMDQVAFGDVPAGMTTAYKHVPNGVYRYAAYRLEVDGQLVTQPVIDWVGEEPMDGEDFTYTIALDPRRPPLQIVQLLDVTRDR
jgi:hypothetical protein